MKNIDDELKGLKDKSKKIKLETLMRLSSELEQELKITNHPMYKTAKKIYSTVKEIYDEKNMERGIEIPALARYYGVKPIEFRKILRSLGVLDKKNKPTEEYKKWFVVENNVYFSQNGNRCVVSKVYFKNNKLRYLERFLKREGGELVKWIKL